MKNKMKPGVSKLAAVLGVILQIVSAIFTVNLLINFAAVGWEKFVYALFGVAIQGSQGLAYIFGWYYLFKNQAGKALPALSIFVLLFGLSLVGTIGFFSVTNANMDSAAYHGDVKFSSLMTDKQAKMAEIERLQQQSQDFADRNWLSKGVKPTEARIAQLQNEVDGLSSGIQSYQPASGTGSFYALLANFFGADAQTVRFVLFILYAIALDLTSAMLLGYTVVADLKKTAVGDGSTCAVSAAESQGMGFRPQPQPMTAAAHEKTYALTEADLARLLEMTKGAGGDGIQETTNKVITGFGVADAQNEPVTTGSLNGVVKATDFGTGICENCNTEFKRMTWNHKFCNEACRVDSWEKRTGAKMRKKAPKR